MIGIRTFCFLFVLLLSTTVEAQILKTNKISVGSDTTNALLGSLNVSFDFQNRSSSPTNQKIWRTFKLTNDLAWLSKSTAFVLINQLNYQSVTGADPLNTGYSHFRIIFKRKTNLSPELFTQVQYDQTRTMPIRFLQGAGFKWNPVNTSTTQLNLGQGIMYEFERWAPKELPEVEKRLWKSTTFIGVNTQITESLALHAINYYQVGRDGELWRNRLSGDIWLELKINSRFSFTSRYSYQYEDQPIIDIRKSITMFSNGLGIKF